GAMQAGLAAFAAVVRVACDPREQPITLRKQAIGVGAGEFRKRVAPTLQAVERPYCLLAYAFGPGGDIGGAVRYRIERRIPGPSCERRVQLRCAHAKGARKRGVAAMNIRSGGRCRFARNVLEEPIQVVERVVPTAALVVYILL